MASQAQQQTIQVSVQTDEPATTAEKPAQNPEPAQVPDDPEARILDRLKDEAEDSEEIYGNRAEEEVWKPAEEYIQRTSNRAR